MPRVKTARGASPESNSALGLRFLSLCAQIHEGESGADFPLLVRIFIFHFSFFIFREKKN